MTQLSTPDIGWAFLNAYATTPVPKPTPPRNKLKSSGREADAADIERVDARNNVSPKAIQWRGTTAARIESRLATMDAGQTELRAQAGLECLAVSSENIRSLRHLPKRKAIQ